VGLLQHASDASISLLIHIYTVSFSFNRYSVLQALPASTAMPAKKLIGCSSPWNVLLLKMPRKWRMYLQPAMVGGVEAHEVSSR
jgi:hypothetical protein